MRTRVKQGLVMILAVALGLLASLALVSCGESVNDTLLPGDTAKEIISNLDSVQAIADSGDCSGAVAEAEQVKQQIDDLPSSVDPKLRNNLEEGAQRLINVLNQSGACVATTETDASATAEPTTDTSTTDTSTTDTGKKPKPEKPGKGPKTPTTTTTTTPEPPTDTTPTTPPTTPGGGGSGSGGIGSGGKSGAGQAPPGAQHGSGSERGSGVS